MLSNLVCQALSGEALTIYGGGSQTQSFCFLGDLVGGLLRLMASDEPRPVNLGNAGEVTMLELAGLVLELTGSPSRLFRRPLPEDDPRQRCPEVSRAAGLDAERAPARGAGAHRRPLPRRAGRGEPTPLAV